MAQNLSAQSLQIVPTMHTLAGTGTGGNGAQGGQATSTNINGPGGVAVDAAGNVYIADYFNNIIRKVDANGVITNFAGTGVACALTTAACGDGGLAVNAQFNAPYSVAVDSSGNVYVADQIDNRIRKIAASTGTITTVVGTGNGTPSNNNVTGLSLNVSHPDSLSVDTNGNIYFADSYDSILYKYTASTQIATKLVGAAGAGFSGDGGLAVAAQVNNVLAVAFDKYGNVFLADQYNNRIREISALGVITTLVGNGTAGFSGDGGAAGSAELNNPRSVAIDTSGNLLIADQNNNRIRMVTSDGAALTTSSIITTVAGNGTVCSPITASCGDGGPATSASFTNGLNNLTYDGPRNAAILSDLTGNRVREYYPYIQFASTQVGTNLTQTVLLVVTGAPMTISSITAALGQNGVAEYTVGAITGCSVSGTSNPVGTVCSVPVTFNPEYPGVRNTMLVANTGAGVETFALNGTGLGSEVALTAGTISTVAGTGTAGNSGNGGAATAATVSAPQGAAVDSQGNLYFADTANNLVRKVAAGTGLISTIAGNGIACGTPTLACGDGVAATSGNLNAPTGVAIDASGDVFIADSGDNRIREVIASSGLISTVAGTGTASYAGDNGLAVSATLSDPVGIAIDASGNLYVADKGNNVIRRIGGMTGDITTVAGNGTACASTSAACGDSGAAAAANLKGPASVAVSPTGFAIADTGDNRVRVVNTSTGVISTIAGTGTAGYSGDGGAGTSANLTAPAGVSTDSAGDIYIADTGDNAVRFVSAGTGQISTIVGKGTACTQPTTACGDGGASTSALLATPYGITLDGAGNLYVSDTGDNKIREVNVSSLALNFASTAVGATSSDSPQSVAVENIGNQALTFSVPGSGTNPTVSTGFNLGVSSTCPQLASTSSAATLAAGNSCAYAVNFAPATAGTFTGTLSPTDNNLNHASSVQTVNLNGVATKGAPTTTLSSAANPSTLGQSVTFTATVGVLGAAPTGTVSFYRGATLLGSGTVNSSGVATFATSTLPVGSDSITAVYAGDSNYNSSTSNVFIQTVAKASGADALTTSNTAPSYGASITLTDTIPTVNGVAPTGTVIFYNGSTAIGTGTVNSSGVATLTTGSLPVGSDSITAVYGGDANYASVTSNAVTETVAKASGADALTTSNASPSYGTSITLIDTIPTANGVAPTGTVTFYNGSTAIGTGTVNSSGVATLTTGSLPVGSDSITAVYGGDANYASVTSNAVTETVAKASGADALTSSNASPSYGTSITLTDTIPTVNGVAPTGTVTFYDGSTVIGTGSVNSSGVATLTTGSLPVGSDSITAVYSGDTNYASVTSNAVTETVAKANGADALTTSNASPGYGASITLTDTIPVVNGVAPTGTVIFYDGSTAIGMGTVSSLGVATLTTGALPVGSDSITAVYGGDANYASVTSNAVAETVAKANGADTLTSSNASPTYGSSVTLTDTIPTVNGVAPTGTVTFYSGGTAIGTGTVNSSGVASLATGSLAVGTDNITAVFSGDANYASVTSNAVTEMVSKANGADALTTSNASPSYGTSVTFTDTIPTVNGVAPTGTVTFYNGSTAIGTGTVNASGVATLATGSLPVGSDSITAVYGGDANYASVTSNAVTETVAKAGGADTLTTSNTAPSYGTSITLTDTIPTVNGAAPTGTVTFYNGSTAIGTGTVNASGVATLTTGSLPVGSDSITAVYGGDANYASVTSNAVTETVAKASGADALTTSNASPSYGTSITFTDTIPTANGVAPTGSVTFYNESTAIGTGTVNSSGVATLTTGSLPVGSDSITAVYGGDANYASVTSNAITETVVKANGADALTSSNASPMYGDPVTFTDTIPIVNGVAPTGMVTFYDGSTAIGTGTVNASGVATLVTGTLPVGSDSITAVYGGDGNYASVTSNAIPETVAKAGGADTLTTSNTAPSYGTSITLTDTIPTVNGVAPTGTVTFYDGSTAIGTGTVNSSGVATLATGSLPVGTDSITAVYSGDANYASVTSNAVTEAVAKASGADALNTSNASPSYGTSITLTDTIPTVNGVVPTGTVTFYDGNTVIGTGTVNASGVATLTTGSLPVGTDSITAVYGGDANYASVTSNAITETVGKASAVDTLTTSNAAPAYGASVTFTDTIPVVNGVAPTGTVTFYNGGTAIGTGTVNASGIAMLTTGSLPIGTDSITAVYGGDANYASVTSNAVTETVAKVHGADTLTASTATPTYGTSVTFTDTVPTVNGVAPTGTVTFYDGNTVIGTGTVNSSGVATLATGSLPVGSDSITAVYGGDANYASVTSNAITETVGKANGADTLTTSNATVSVGTAVTFTDTIPTVNGVAPTGTVTFYNGSVVIGMGTVSSSGVATLTTSTLPAGTDTISAVYGGDANYASVTSNSVSEVVGTPDTLTVSNANPMFGSSITLTLTVPMMNGFVPTGTVTFYDNGVAIGTGTINANGVATFTTGSLPVGPNQVITAYSGDTNYPSANSGPVNVTVAKATGPDTLTASNTTPAFGAPVTLTDTIPTVGGVAPTGTVTFYDNGTAIGTGTVNASGIATLTTGTLPVGADNITAVYGGDSNYGPVTAGPLTVTVSKGGGTGSDTLSTSNVAPSFGTSITLTDTIPTIDGVAPTGTVTFYSNGTAIGTGTVNASGVATLTTGALPVGNDTITTAYSGDGNYSAGTSNSITETVGKANGAETLAASATTSMLGQQVTFTDTIPVVNGIAPTGTATFYNGGTAIGTGTVNASGVATLTTGVLPLGTDTITASYTGDANYAAGTSNSVMVTVGKGDNTDTLTASSSTSTFGQPVTFTDMVAPINAVEPTGTVTFYLGTTALGSGTVNASGVAMLATSALPVGTDSITANYGGDGNFAASVSNAVSVSVAKAAGLGVLTSSNATSTFGAAITLTDTLSVVNGIVPTGTVTFYAGSTAIGTGTVSSTGVATLTTGSLPVGVTSITAVYGGDANYAQATSNAVTETVATAGSAGSDTLTTSDPTPVLGESVTFTETIAVVNGVVPTGTVTFYIGTTVLGTATVNSSGVATLTTTSVPTGTSNVTAAYSGDAHYSQSTSSPVTETVVDFSIAATPANQTINSGDSTSYTVSLAGLDVAFNHPVTLSATGLPPGGSVLFSPASLTPGTGPAPTTMTLFTSPSSVLEGRETSGIAYGLLLLPMLGLKKIRRKLRSLPRILLYPMAAFLLITLTGSLTGCGGGYFGHSPNTYTITVTGTSGTLHHSTSVTVTVR